MNRRTATSSMYMFTNTENMQRDCPGSVYDRSKHISVMILEEDVSNNGYFYLKDIVYISLEEAYNKYVLENSTNYPEPYSHIRIVFPEVLKQRIVSQMRFSELGEIGEISMKECFEKFCDGTEEKNERVYLDNVMHFDDHLIDWRLSSDLNLREVATNIIKESNNGSWLLRRSSIREQEHIKVRVITLKKDDKIFNFLFAHINGLGYVMTNGYQGQTMPKIGENLSVNIQLVFYSLPDVLDYMKTQGLSIKDNKV